MDESGTAGHVPRLAARVGEARGRWLLGAVLLVGLALRLVDFSQDVSGHHAWRQAHVASNILYYLREGITVGTKTFAKNEEFPVYDFPVYQQAVAVICKATGADPLRTGRAVNLAVYLATGWVLFRILRRLEVSQRLALLTVALMAISPLDAYYSRGIMVDNACVLFAYAALLFYLRWRAAPGGAPLDFGAMLVAAVVSALIKSPVTFVVVVAIGLDALACAAFRPWRIRPGVWAFLTAVGASVVAFRLYSNWMNVGSLSTPESDRLWFFGTLAQRLRLRNYATVLDHLALSPLAALLVAMGALLFFERRRAAGRDRAVLVGLGIGVLLSVVVFFNLHVAHDYYQLPFVFPVAFFTAQALDWTYEQASTPGTRAALVALAVLVLGAAYRLQHPSTAADGELADAGRFIRESTEPGAGVLYAKPRADWDPGPLYFADREGYNIGPNPASGAFESYSGKIAFDRAVGGFEPVDGISLERTWATAEKRWRRVYVFCPKAVDGCRSASFAGLGLVVKKETARYLLLAR